MPHCIDSNTIIEIIHVKFDGQNWEKSYENDATIKDLSKNN